MCNQYLYVVNFVLCIYTLHIDYYFVLFYKSIVVKSLKFHVLNYTAISLLTCPLSFVMVYRIQMNE
jgi:hypothetical protein